MKKSIFIGLALVLIITGCSSVKNVEDKAEAEVVDKPLYQLNIRSEDGASQPQLSPGESVVLVAKGVDEDGNKVEVAPTWKTDNGSVDPKKGKKTTFTLSEDASGITAFVTAKQEDVEGKITIEIK